jgi:hypothetical protein
MDFYLGGISGKRADWKKATELLQKCLQMRPDDGPSHTILKYIQSTGEVNYNDKHAVCYINTIWHNNRINVVFIHLWPPLPDTVAVKIHAELTQACGPRVAQLQNFGKDSGRFQKSNHSQRYELCRSSNTVYTLSNVFQHFENGREDRYCSRRGGWVKILDTTYIISTWKRSRGRTLSLTHSLTHTYTHHTHTHTHTRTLTQTTLTSQEPIYMSFLVVYLQCLIPCSNLPSINQTLISALCW